MTTPAPFGRLLTAMVTPFTKDGAIDWAGIETIAAHLVSNGHDGIVVNGTTGEAPTTKSSEKEEIIRVVRNTVGPTIKVLSGAGDNETEYSINQAKRTEKAGADGLLVVTPYYNKPPQAGIEAHFRAVADATDLPMMMYDIPGRTGVPIEPDTLVRLSEHPRIVALKDAKGDVASTSWVIKRCEFLCIQVMTFSIFHCFQLAQLVSFQCVDILLVKICVNYLMHGLPETQLER
jgi:4-hydroxy-tetrahydrodipicolinate synthase